jgi:hypothetical protein
VLATELANIYVRLCLQKREDAKGVFDSNWLLNVYNLVTAKEGNKGKTTQPPPLLLEALKLMPAFQPVSRKGITQIILYECVNLAAVASNNVWMHFRKRVLRFVRVKKELSKEAYRALSKEERVQRKLKISELAWDLLRHPDEKYKSRNKYRREWVDFVRTKRLDIDAAVGRWGDKPIEYHLKERPHAFLPAMAYMNSVMRENSKRCFSLFPLRRSMVPRHCRFDVKALKDLIISPEDAVEKKAKRAAESTSKQKAAKRKKGVAPPPDPQASEDEDDDLGLGPLVAQPMDTASLGGTFSSAGAEHPEEEPQSAPMETTEDPSAPLAGGSATAPRKRAPRRGKEDASLLEEKDAAFGRVLNVRLNAPRGWAFDHAFTTDGVCARVQFRLPARGGGDSPALKRNPARGMYTIDELKRVSRLAEWHVVGMDPGKREIICAVDGDNQCGKALRYTLRQRLKDRRSGQYAKEARDSKPESVAQAEALLAGFNSRASACDGFCEYLAARHRIMEECLTHYADINHRRRRWKTVIKTQKSEARLFNSIKKKFKTDKRRLVLAYGSWGAVAGRPDMACNKGNPPCIGVGMMRKLAKHFVVALTPEHYTSKTCNRCMCACGPWKEVEEKMNKTKKGIRGLRRCTHRDCMLPLNRDQNGAANIALQFGRLFRGIGPIKTMSPIETRLNDLAVCVECG